MFLSSADGYVVELLELTEGCQDPLEVPEEGGVSLEMQKWKRASSRVEGESSGISRVRQQTVFLSVTVATSGILCGASGTFNLHAICEGPLGILVQSLPWRGPHLELMPEPQVSSQLAWDCGSSGFLQCSKASSHVEICMSTSPLEL